MLKRNKIILDTHVFIWFVLGEKKIPVDKLALINNHLEFGSVYIAAISLWEIAMLERRARFAIHQPCLQWINNSLKETGINVASLTPEIAVESVNLPGELHGDPADRLITATARYIGASLFTRDKKILAYAKEKHIECVKV